MEPGELDNTGKTKHWIDLFNPDFYNENNEVDYENYNAPDHFYKYLEFMQGERPYVLAGTYLSGTNCDYEQLHFPVERLDCALFTEQDFLMNGTEVYHPFGSPTRHYINLSNYESSKKLGDLIIGEARTRGLDFIYLDNINYHYSFLENQGISWTSTLNHLDYIHDELKADDIGLLINIGAPPYQFAGDDFNDADRLADVVDGMSFELPFHPNTRKDINLLRDEIAVTRRWLDAGKVILHIGRKNGLTMEQNEERMYLHAALAMIIREPGDSLFVGRPEFIYPVNASWIYWPQEFGNPIGDYDLSSSGNVITLGRSFENGNIYVTFTDTGDDVLSEYFTTNCGDGVLDPGEECDSPHIGSDCQGLGFDDGILACYSNCTYDTSGCTNEAECIPTQEICNGLDDDCDGIPDNGITCECTEGQTRPCGTTDTGECEYGTQTCINGNWSECAGATEPSEEICDGKDNDCDGQVDENLTDTCGTDKGVCEFGIQTCVDGAWGSCIGGTGPSEEVCNNTLDDDCNGIVDDGCFTPQNVTCQEGQIPNIGCLCDNQIYTSGYCLNNRYFETLPEEFPWYWLAIPVLAIVFSGFALSSRKGGKKESKEKTWDELK